MMKQRLSLFLMSLFCYVKLSSTLGNNTGDSNFQVLLGDVDLGPLSQRPELFKVAALQNELVNVTDDQQTAVVTVGVNIHLDWSSWVFGTLDADSAQNATYTFYKTQLSGYARYVQGPVLALQPSEHVQSDKELFIFYVEITCAVLTPDNESDSGIYELEACILEPNGNQQCYRSNITIFVIDRPEPLMINCGTEGVIGDVSASCRSANSNPIELVSCTIEAVDSRQAFSCIVMPNGPEYSLRLTTASYSAGNYSIIFYFTDVYGQSSQERLFLHLIEPPLGGERCSFTLNGLTIICELSITMVWRLTYNCSFDGGPPLQCGQNVTIDKSKLSLGSHNLTVTIITEGGQTAISEFVFETPRFILSCSVVENRIVTIHCEGINGDINESEVACIYGSGQIQEKCELPAINVEFLRFDSNPGDHNITIVANSTTGEMTNFTYKFHIPEIECIQLTEPGRVTVICQVRVTLSRDLQPFCRLDVNIACGDIHNILIVSSELPAGISELSLPMEVNFTISIFDSMGVLFDTSLPVKLSEEQLVECSTTVNCSFVSTLMSARECCVNSVDGLSYSIPGQQQCHTCIVFGWFQNSFNGVEQDSAYSLSVGYLKGAEQAGVSSILNLNVMIMTTPGNATTSDISLETTNIQVMPIADPQTILFTFLPDGIAELGGNESLNLHLVPMPSTLRTIPTGQGVFFKNVIPLTIMDEPSLQNSGGVDAGLIGGVVAAVLVVLAVLLVTVTLYISCHFYRTSRIKSYQNKLLEGKNSFSLNEELTELSVKSSFELKLPPHLIFSSSSIKLNETIGQGEFGIVYKGYIKKGDSNSVDEYLAIKTLKGFYNRGMVKDMLKECSRMSTFDHVHVLTLKGVCLDGGPAPYIIMPFMTNGSLLVYLKKNRNSLVISSEDDDQECVDTVCKQLMDMCIQVAKGMEYLASMKVVHRDLAARNCMIDINFVIKVADFGLSENIGVKEYFRQDEQSPVKLPLKWLAPESIDDHIFSEKSDVWAYGVTCWEIFSGGKVPYAEVPVREISKLLANDYRLEKPSNNACGEEMYSFMHQCWSGEPEHRPSFSQLVESLSSSLEAMAGYVHIGAFGVRSQSVCDSEDAHH